MNAWVFRHLDELQRIYGSESGSESRSGPRHGAPQGADAGCVQVLELNAPGIGASKRQPASQGRAPLGSAAATAAEPMDPVAKLAGTMSPGELIPGSVIRCETPDGPDVILAPAKRQHRPRR